MLEIRQKEIAMSEKMSENMSEKTLKNVGKGVGKRCRKRRYMASNNTKMNLIN